MSIGRVPGVTGIQPSIVDAKGDLIVATAADSVDRLAVGTNEQRLVADSATATGLKYVADTTNYAIAAKGDLLVGTGADTLAALTVGTNGHTLVADSSTATGLAWSAPAANGLVFISSTTFSAASTVNINDVFSSTYDNYVIKLNYSSTADGDLHYRFRVSGADNSTSVYQLVGADAEASSWNVFELNNQDRGRIGPMRNGEFSAVDSQLFNPNLSREKFLISNCIGIPTTAIRGSIFYNTFDNTTTFTGISLLTSSGTITGECRIYGYKNS